ncbi:hypothetical protein FB547_101214 [Variovorax beijingensis]|uniref:Uncharacterized protein n=2 Tax=Variovorax TaxID=34072 RepID=A0AAE3XVS5_VARPD|nr:MULTISPECIES: hypothetical protein [Variovorax]MDP9966106.1 hypothetical protein [Variovorax paradoxus]MDR6425530.1 hypothetical protein [Variovorax paradoxus]TWD90548.1 hypothetical protein FB547_101214 [Variovorax beijingensis]
MSTRFFEALFANHFINRIGHKTAFALAMLLCVLWSTAAALRAPPEAPMAMASHEWPSQWDGIPLRPLALGDVEQRFADRFPGAIGRMTDGTQTIVMRAVNAPTRMLHPAADCYRALGFRIEQARLERDVQERLWRCFVAQRHSTQKIRVCERIVDAEGTAFTDTSAWYWAAASGRSSGPWQAVTVARPM